MKNLLPREVLDSLHDRYRAGVDAAEAMFEESEADEDALTGALGQAISMPHAQTFITGQGVYSVRVSYRKIRGRGKGAPEKALGADGIFQSIISDVTGKQLFRKGLPFQSKKRWRGKLKGLWS